MPARRLGQHFLVDGATADCIVAAFAPAASDRVLEIGPGRGVLTRRVAPRVARLVAVELDLSLVGPLAAELAEWPGAEVVHGDALAVDWLAALGGGPVRLLSNLPYSISTPIILRLVETGTVSDAHLMLQREFALRMTARPGRKESAR